MSNDPLRPPPLVLERTFSHPPDAVFAAWSDAERVKRWFAPAHFTVPDAVIEFHPGGRSEVCMRSPDGDDFWSRGRYETIVPGEKIVTFGGVDVDGETKFTARTTAVFSPVDTASTRLEIRQEYEVFEPAYLAAIDGASAGWSSTLDKLASELDRSES